MINLKGHVITLRAQRAINFEIMKSEDGTWIVQGDEHTLINDGQIPGTMVRVSAEAPECSEAIAKFLRKYMQYCLSD